MMNGYWHLRGKTQQVIGGSKLAGLGDTELKKLISRKSQAIITQGL